jgi:hypothetical protein
MEPRHVHIVALVMIAYFLITWIFSSKSNENVRMKNFLTKIQLFLGGILYMVTSKDGKGLGPKNNPDPDLIANKPTMTKRIVFMRHGESDWNDIFNKGFGPSMFVRLIKAQIRELRLMVTMDSVFLDSPLNEDGIEQAKELSRYLEAEASNGVLIPQIIMGYKESAVVVSSNLRRALSTTTIALWPRIHRLQEKIMILSSLQEISRNIDTKALAEKRALPVLDRIAHHCGHDDVFIPENVYDATENHGNKTTAYYGIKRLKAFNEWAFLQKETTIVVGGHSLWFKHFFQTFMPFGSDHPAKTKKIVNSGVIAFTLHRWEDEFGAPSYRIEPEGIETVYGGFTTK